MAAIASATPMLRALLRRRPTRTELAVAAMAVLLGVLAVLQYRWVGQLSTDERERLRSHADNQAENLTEEFNRELTRAFFWLQVGPELRRDAPLEAEVDRYARWYSAAPRPELVKTIYRLTEPPAETGAWTSSASAASRPGSRSWTGRPSSSPCGPTSSRRSRRSVTAAPRCVCSRRSRRFRPS